MTIIKQASQLQISGLSQPAGASRASSQSHSMSDPSLSGGDPFRTHSEDEALDEFGAVPARSRRAMLALGMVACRREATSPVKRAQAK